MRRLTARGFRAGLRARRPSATPDRDRLDALADAVARDLDRGALASAWDRTRALEQEADPTAPRAPAEPVPPVPVIGRRFAAAHRRMLFDPPVGERSAGGFRTHPAA